MAQIKLSLQRPYFFSLECVDKSNTKQWPLIICRLTQFDREDKETYFGKENEIIPSVVSSMPVLNSREKKCMSDNFCLACLYILDRFCFGLRLLKAPN